jgi:hypothetical protein
MSRLLTVAAVSLLLWTSACSLPPGLTITPTPTPYIYPTALTPETAALTVEQLRNAEYTITGFDNSSRPYRFTDGKYTQGSDPAAPDYINLWMLDLTDFGDLNEDGDRKSTRLNSSHDV